LVRENPDVGALWEALGLCSLRLGEHETAVRAYERAIATGLRPASGYYNIACALALAGEGDAALAALERAYALGFANEHLLRQDEDLRSLHADPRFRRLVGWPRAEDLSRAERWRADIEFLDRRLREVHWNLFGALERGDYERLRGAILARIDRSSDAELEWQLRCWLARIGDGHTALALDEFVAVHMGPHAPVELLPLSFFEYAEGVRVKSATAELAAWAGARLLAVGDAPIDSLLAWTDRGASRDNEPGLRWTRTLLLSDPRTLRGLGLESKEGTFVLRLQPLNGSAAPLALRPGGFELLAARQPHWMLREQERSLSQRQAGQALYVEPDVEHGLLYARIDAIADGEAESLAEFGRRIVALRREQQLPRLVLDLRNNHGGQGELTRPLLHELIRDPAFAEPGALWVLLGRETFSAAMAFAAQLELHTAARFVGEASGSRPNFVGETTLVQLPYSQRWVSISSRYHQNGRSDDKRLWIAPSLPAPPDFQLERLGRDPGLEAIRREVKASR
jgi:hypothetical protein